MNKFIILLVILAHGSVAHGEIWNHTNRSKVFDFQLNITGITNEDGHVDECSVTITVFNKLTKTTTQTIQCGPRSVFGGAFTRLGSTGTNAGKEMLDNNVGDFLVNDFNFDNRDDFALKTENHASAEPYYEYYIQNKSGQFVRDDFLSDEIGRAHV